MTPTDSCLPSVLLVDDDPIVIHALYKALQGTGVVRFATTGEEALSMARHEPPDLVLLDAEMPGMSGFEVCAALQRDPALTKVPVIFVTSHAGTDFEERGFAAGAVDFIAKPIRPAIVVARARTHLRLKQATDALKVLSSTDTLTGLANRRAFNDALAREWERMLRSAEPIAALMIDVDHFKKYNDLYGHPQGDQCLAAVAQALQAELMRPTDLAARYGGEEFVVLLPSTAARGARALADRVLERLERLAIPHAASDLGQRLTVSIGWSSFDGDCALWSTGQDLRQGGPPLRAGPADLVAAADRALYAAKAAGRAQSQYAALDDVAKDRLATAWPH
jgi:diguanylate cyclase (GGDEF)-like protein